MLRACGRGGRNVRVKTPETKKASNVAGGVPADAPGGQAPPAEGQGRGGDAVDQGDGEGDEHGADGVPCAAEAGGADLACGLKADRPAHDLEVLDSQAGGLIPQAKKPDERPCAKKEQEGNENAHEQSRGAGSAGDAVGHAEALGTDGPGDDSGGSDAQCGGHQAGEPLVVAHRGDGGGGGGALGVGVAGVAADDDVGEADGGGDDLFEHRGVGQRPDDADGDRAIDPGPALGGSGVGEPGRLFGRGAQGGDQILTGLEAGGVGRWIGGREGALVGVSHGVHGVWQSFRGNPFPWAWADRDRGFLRGGLS